MLKQEDMFGGEQIHPNLIDAEYVVTDISTNFRLVLIMGARQALAAVSDTPLGVSGKAEGLESRSWFIQAAKERERKRRA